MSNTTSLRINEIIEESVVDGPGFRLVVFTQGCPHGCEGCHNPQTHDFNGGRTIGLGEILALLDQNPLLAGLTLSGGEPFCQAAACAELAREVKKRGKNVVTFSGFTYEELTSMTEPGVPDLLMGTDILIDGRFVLAERDLSIPFRGSRNQRMLYLKEGKIIKQA